MFLVQPEYTRWSPAEPDTMEWMAEAEKTDSHGEDPTDCPTDIWVWRRVRNSQ